jgi:hypothetical protein
LLRWREEAFRQEHAEENLRFYTPISKSPFTERAEEYRRGEMEILYTNCAGLDVHKKTVKVCLLTQAANGQPRKEFRTYFTTTEELLKLCDWLKEQGCTHRLRGNRCVLETGVQPAGRQF